MDEKNSFIHSFMEQKSTTLKIGSNANRKTEKITMLKTGSDANRKGQKAALSNSRC
jgi:hypothetical protein